MLSQKARLVLVSSSLRRALSLRAVHSGRQAALAVAAAVAAVAVLAAVAVAVAAVSLSLLVVSWMLPAEPVACLSQSCCTVVYH
jgi:hypothetical protein